MELAWEQALLFIILFTIPAFVVFITTFYVLKSFFNAEYQRRQYEIRGRFTKITLPIRLQAYERMVLLLERLAPNNLIYRVKKGGMSATDLEVALLAEIRAEYDHNLSQQLYISPESWQAIRNAKEELVKLINVSYSKLDKGATALDLSRAIFDRVMEHENHPTYRALTVVKKEAQRIF